MTANDIGPIARKIIAAGRKQQRQQLVDLQAVRGARDQMRRIIDEAIPASDVGEQYPGFAAYIYVTNWALGLVEAAQDMKELWRHVDRIAKADEDYMPEGPPWSPITRSMFNAWSLCDLTVGVKRESLGSILLAIGRTVGMDPLFLGVLEQLVDSRLGLHVHEGIADDRITLRELVTGEVRPCICPSGHEGDRGEVWLARVLPPPAASLQEAIVHDDAVRDREPGIGGLAVLPRSHLAEDRERPQAGLPAVDEARPPREILARVRVRGVRESPRGSGLPEGLARHPGEPAALAHQRRSPHDRRRLLMGKRKKKNRNLGPRRKRMRRQARLMAAVKWRSGYGGKNIVHGYARWFGVDLICAITELRMLGVAVDLVYEAQLRRTIAARATWRARRRAEKLAAKARPVEIEWPDDWPVEWIPREADGDAMLDDIPF